MLFLQMNVLNVMSLLIELLGSQMKPFLGTLLQLLPALWDASEEHNLLRCAIINTLVHVVKVRSTTSCISFIHSTAFFFFFFFFFFIFFREWGAIRKICCTVSCRWWRTALIQSSRRMYIYSKTLWPCGRPWSSLCPRPILKFCSC